MSFTRSLLCFGCVLAALLASSQFAEAMQVGAVNLASSISGGVGALSITAKAFDDVCFSANGDWDGRWWSGSGNNACGLSIDELAFSISAASSINCTIKFYNMYQTKQPLLVAITAVQSLFLGLDVNQNMCVNTHSGSPDELALPIKTVATCGPCDPTVKAAFSTIMVVNTAKDKQQVQATVLAADGAECASQSGEAAPPTSNLLNMKCQGTSPVGKVVLTAPYHGGCNVSIVPASGRPVHSAVAVMTGTTSDKKICIGKVSVSSPGDESEWNLEGDCPACPFYPY